MGFATWFVVHYVLTTLSLPRPDPDGERVPPYQFLRKLAGVSWSSLTPRSCACSVQVTIQLRGKPSTAWLRPSPLVRRLSEQSEPLPLDGSPDDLSFDTLQLPAGATLYFTSGPLDWLNGKSVPIVPSFSEVYNWRTRYTRYLRLTGMLQGLGGIGRRYKQEMCLLVG